MIAIGRLSRIEIGTGITIKLVLRSFRRWNWPSFLITCPFSTFLESKGVISGYARNEELVTALEGKAYEKCFPIHFTYLRNQFDAAVEKQRLRKSVARTLCDLFKMNHPYHMAIQKILSYMKDNDLKFLKMVWTQYCVVELLWKLIIQINSVSVIILANDINMHKE